MLKTYLNCGNNSIHENTNNHSDIDCIVKMSDVSQSAANQVTDLEVQRLHDRPRYRINEEFFDSWSEPMAYILGYIYADGNISRDRCRFKISSKDLDHLTKIRDYMECDMLLKCKYNKYGSWYDLTVSRLHITNRLRELGVIPNKSLTMAYPEIPDQYMSHFIRGYFDGDGSVYKYKNRPNAIQIDFACGSESFIGRLHDILVSTIGDYYTLVNRRTNYWRIRGNTEGSKKLFNYMYNEATIYMDRKYNRFLECDSINGDDIVQTHH